MRQDEVRVERFKYRDVWGREGHCDIEARKLAAGRVGIIATERKDNPGMSITNAAEYVATAVCKHLGIYPQKLVWIEYYGYPPPAGLPKRTYDLVTFAQITPLHKPFFHAPAWAPMKEEDWRSLGLEPRT